MNFPREVVDYLQGSFWADMRPACLLVNADFILIESWGDTAWCALDDVRPGTNMLACAPYLFGSLNTEMTILEFVSLPSNIVAHVHTIPKGDQHYVVLLDARQEHDALQQKQQTVNELRLLHASQQRLISRQRDLISELVEAKAELDHHRRDAERASASKGQFIAMMSHEFRTPLASIINYADMASEPDAAPSTLKKSTEAIGRSARHLTALVEAVLDEARLDAGQLDLRETSFDLHALLEDLCAMMAPLAADKTLSFSCRIGANVPQRIIADDVRLRQILINLLGNAVKFTEEGGVQLVVTYADDKMTAAIADTGPGISAEHQSNVFEAFERGDTREQAGAGLGLSISLKLARLMGGDLSLESTLGQGCTVTATLPVSISTDTHNAVIDALAAPIETAHATKATSVLVCDDDEDMLALIEHYLHRAGYGLIVARTGTDAVKKALAYEPDIVLMDCHLPDLSGIQAATEIRKAGFAKPIIALTAAKLSETDKAQFTVDFRKPADMPILLAKIKSLSHY